MNRKKIWTAGCSILVLFLLVGCGAKQSATINNRMVLSKTTTPGAVVAPTDTSDPEYNAFVNSMGDSEIKDTDQKVNNSSYHCNIKKDKENFNGKVDIVVGDKLYATQINDWYENFDKYKGKVVEIEGYFIREFAPYQFVGRYGPSCPYCNGGYVSFEIYTTEDLSKFNSVDDWVKVIGILREGEDDKGKFYFIETLSLTKMKNIGKDTVTN